MIRGIVVQLQCLGITSVLVIYNRTLLLQQQGFIYLESPWIILPSNYFRVIYQLIAIKISLMLLFSMSFRCTGSQMHSNAP